MSLMKRKAGARKGALLIQTDSNKEFLGDLVASQVLQEVLLVVQAAQVVQAVQAFQAVQAVQVQAVQGSLVQEVGEVQEVSMAGRDLI